MITATFRHDGVYIATWSSLDEVPKPGDSVEVGGRNYHVAARHWSRGGSAVQIIVTLPDHAGSTP